MIYKNILDLIGNTPMFRLNNLEMNDKLTDIYVKLEKSNPAGSVKDRAVLGMIEGLEKRGELNKSDVLVEATSGNTGIALSMVGRVKGYEVVIVMPETMSIERRNLMKAYGARLILTDGKEGMAGALNKAQELLNNNPNYKSLKQFENEDNPDIHYRTTAVEIYNDLEDIDIFITGVGTSGTLTGVARYLKERKPDVKIVAIEPTKSPTISEGKSGPHKIQGIGANFIPANYDKTLVDEVITVDDDDAFEMVRILAEKEGLLVGVSAGANVFGALEIAKKYPGKKIVTIAPDGIDKYMSMGIFD
ncbi:cysteine synthase A [Clostridioides mangenotii]|uniref:cysteine synthase A n=1 Tax=Metaclostridioides mangenotii TaxID=1540 RepID=UPI00214A5EA5|nr:cysteine synthase A [Clostridioides mangenotii]MCR1954550.1 cysteine synthase A [Clostridioides mangenotii]